MAMFRALKFAAAFVSVAVQVPTPVQAEGEAAGQTVQLLFVQNAQGVVVDRDKGTLTLNGISPTTMFFSDRPYRIAGHYTTDEYLAFWKDGTDSFLTDPPNATLSVFETGRDDLVDLVVELRNPRLDGANLTYDIAILNGTSPGPAAPHRCSLTLSACR